MDEAATKVAGPIRLRQLGRADWPGTFPAGRLLRRA